MKTKSKAFWTRIKNCKKIVKTWPKWKQNIVISAESASTGKFLKVNTPDGIENV